MIETKPLREFPENIQQTALAAFAALANAQRGKPEYLATSIPSNPGLWNAMGVFTWMAEHVGDLTHRMSEKRCQDMRYGDGPVSEKVRKALRIINNGYGFWREAQGNLKNNYEYRKEKQGLHISFDMFLDEWADGAKAYAEAHAALTVWNEAQWCAREAAVSLGLRQFNMLEHYLNKISQELAKGDESWSDWASNITVDDGELVPFRRRRLREDTNLRMGYDLKARYAYYNRLLYDGKLPDIPIEWKVLKRDGGQVVAKTRVDPAKPKPNPLMVRLRLVDKFSNCDLVPGSLKMHISPLYKRDQRALDQIMIHEMIHVHFISIGLFGENHGLKFLSERARCSKVVGFDIPLKDNVKGLEQSEPTKVVPLGIVLVEDNRGKVSAAIVNKTTLQNNVELFKAMLKRRATVYGDKISIYIVTDDMWSTLALRKTVQRKPHYLRTFWVDDAAVEDVKKNGTLVGTIDPRST